MRKFGITQQQVKDSINVGIYVNAYCTITILSII